MIGQPRTTGWLAVFGFLAFVAATPNDVQAAEAKAPLAEVRVRVLSAQRQGSTWRLLHGAPLFVWVEVEPALGRKVKDAQALWENEKKRFKAAGLTEEQIQKRLLYDTYAREMKAIAEMKTQPVPLGKGWQQQVRFDLTQADGRKMKVLTDVDWKRYLHRYDPQQQTLTDEALHVQWLVPPEVARQLQPGTYELKVTVSKMTSAPLRVVVKEPQGKEEQTELTLRLLKYHLETGNYDEAIRRSTQALPSASSPLLLQALHSTLGDAYRGKGQWAKALEHYEKALELSKVNYPTEPPEGLLNRISEVRSKLRSKG